MTTTKTPNPAEAYQSYFGPAMFEPLTERVLAVAAPAAGEHVIDVACGTGILTRRAAAHAAPGGRVVALDSNPAMIEVARAIAPDAGSAPIECRQGDGTALDEHSGTYDVAYCQQGLQFFPTGLPARPSCAVWCGTAAVRSWRSGRGSAATRCTRRSRMRRSPTSPLSASR